MAATPNIPQWHLFNDRNAQAQVLAAHVASALQRDLAQKASATLLVSGGRSPARFFERLARFDLDWERVWIMPVDERASAVQPDSRNEWLIRHHLLTDHACCSQLVPLDRPLDAPALKARVSWPPTLAVLGMGEDGHAASWFPGDPASMLALQDDAAPAVVATHASSGPVERLTLNWAAVAEAGQRALLITGDAKRTLLERTEADGADWHQYPVARLFSAPLTVFWSP
ncbi:6-phosphogluconolactonase [Salicola sp. Rm-C-2C1-2]|uniref:6-phosphogluconolactonase n=1 Tax=Salicola sp. Rm-C-2C1-2 TaxID=3141321 RepID=UPI0032E4BF61